MAKGERLIKKIWLPILVITIGIASLLNVMEVMKGVDWSWTLGLAVAGFVILATGINRLTLVIGPLLVLGSIFSLLRQSELLSWKIELAVLVIALGLLMLLAQILQIPSLPKFMESDKQQG